MNDIQLSSCSCFALTLSLCYCLSIQSSDGSKSLFSGHFRCRDRWFCFYSFCTTKTENSYLLVPQTHPAAGWWAPGADPALLGVCLTGVLSTSRVCMGQSWSWKLTPDYLNCQGETHIPLLSFYKLYFKSLNNIFFKCWKFFFPLRSIEKAIYPLVQS